MNCLKCSILIENAYKSRKYCEPCNIIKAREHSKEWNKRNPKDRAKFQKAYADRNPDKTKAHRRDKNKKKSWCERCLSEVDLEFHHTNCGTGNFLCEDCNSVPQKQVQNRKGCGKEVFNGGYPRYCGNNIFGKEILCEDCNTRGAHSTGDSLVRATNFQPKKSIKLEGSSQEICKPETLCPRELNAQRDEVHAGEIPEHVGEQGRELKDASSQPAERSKDE